MAIYGDVAMSGVPGASQVLDQAMLAVRNQFDLVATPMTRITTSHGTASNLSRHLRGFPADRSPGFRSGC